MRIDAAIVVGAGLGGLATALALARRGVAVQVLEQASQLGEAGAGITLSPGAMRSLELLGAGAAVDAASEPSVNLPFVHFRSGELLRRGLDGGSRAASSRTARQIHRADLHRILVCTLATLAPAAIETGWRCVSMQREKDRIVLVSQDGRRRAAPWVFGCDGIRSAVRGAIFGEQPLEFLGQVAYRCLVPAQIAARHVRDPGGKVFLGPGCAFNRYPLRQGAVMNCVGLARTDAWREEGWNTPASNAEFLARFNDWHDEVTGLIRDAPPAGIIKWALFGRAPLPSWRSGRVTLLGDAAHPLLPFLGLGAAMALEDAALLGRVLDDFDDAERALQAWERARRPRVDRVTIASRAQGELSQRLDPDHYSSAAAPAHDPSFFDYDPKQVEL